ncbi:MAG: O-antigen ligase family protein [Caulobacteraceae bacterium]
MNRAATISGAAQVRPALAIAAFFALLPAIAVGGAIGLPLLMGLTGLASIRPSTLLQVIEKKPVILGLLIVLLLWAAASSAWSPWDGETHLKVPALLALGLLFASAASSAAVARLSLAGALAALIVLLHLLAVEAVWAMPLNTAAAPGESATQLNQNPARGVVVMLALVWPALAWLIASPAAWRWAAAPVVAIAAGLISLQFGQLSTAIGFAVGLAFFAFAFWAPRLAMLAPTLGLAVWMVTTPFLTPVLASQTLFDAVPHSWAARIGIWRYTCARILEQPWIGHGLDAGRATTERTIYDGEPMRAIPVHPHSASLQIWYETGAVGALLAAAIIFLTGAHVARAFTHDKPAAAAAAGVFAMFGLMANVGWSVWQEWWMATLILAGALIAAIGARDAKA